MAAAEPQESVPTASHAGQGTRVPGRMAYLSLQAVEEGQDTWAAVMEIVNGFEAAGWVVDRYFVSYSLTSKRSALARAIAMWRVQRDLARALGSYDALYVRSHALAWPTARRARRRGVVVVQECNGPYEDLYIAWPSTRIARPLLDAMMRAQYRMASAVIAVADGLTQWLQCDTGNPHIVTNGNGANTAVFTPEAPRRPGLPERFAVFFGMFPPWQGIGTLLEAVRLPEWPAGLPLVFVGDGAMRPAVEEAAAAAPGTVIYLGRLPYAEVAQVAAHAVLSFVPMVAPERETMFSPLKLYESMACGVPVVASDVTGISEVVNGCDCGILVPAGDAAAIAEATRTIAGDPERARAMGARGRQAAVERYSWKARARERLAVVEDALERARGDRPGR